MKKKILMTALACAVGIACTLGAAACKKDNGEGENTNDSGAPDVGNSIQVTAVEWKAAYDSTMAATNFTYIDEEKTEETYQGENGTGESTCKAYFWNGKKYSDTTSVYEYAGERETDSMYEYLTTEDEKIYYASTEDGSWMVMNEADYFGVDLNDYIFFLNSFNGNQNIGDLYSEFTYADGKYNATLTVDSTQNDITLSVKINEAGYISYIQWEWNNSYSEGYSKDTGKLTIYDYGTTDFKGVPQEAKQAIEDYKAQNTNS